MALIVEDGTIVTDANSFLSLADARAIADTYGVTLPTDDTEAEQALVNGTSYLSTYESRLSGCRVSSEQSLMYPREGVCLYGFELDNDVIPDNLKRALVFAAADISDDGNPWGDNDDGKTITSEKLDVLQTDYAENGVTGSSYVIPRVDSEMKPLLGDNSAYSFNVSRG